MTGNEIAIIGMAGRFPQADDIYEYWENIREGKECITVFTRQELEDSGIPVDMLDHENYVRAKGWIGDIDKFDAGFFGINPAEAELMDPQHRLLLECAWHALENAGYNPKEIAGSVGVYASQSMSSYLILNVLSHVRKVLAGGNLVAAIGNDKDSLTSTISYRLNLKGPAVTVQSSSSSSLVAVNIACQSLMTYQCDMAIAGGITVGPPEKSGYLYEEGGIMSKDGHGRSFDESSSGFVPGNGYGLVVLKRLEEAIRDRDHIWAVIKGSAVNNDGSEKVSYTAPSVDMQAQVVKMAHAMSGVEPESIGYIEAHGTGTKMGDPIEVRALNRAFADDKRKQACAIGSVKANIGHLDSAAGVAGLIKAALVLYHCEIPPQVNLEKENTQLQLAETPFYIERKGKEWKTDHSVRRAGVTSLGMGGTNCHIILEETPVRDALQNSGEKYLLAVSGHTKEAFENNRRILLNHLKKNSRRSLNSISYTLLAGRKAFSYRAAAVCENVEEAVAKLEEMTAQTSKPCVFVVQNRQTVNTDFVACLYRDAKSFRKTFAEGAELFLNIFGWDVNLCLKKEKTGNLECERAFAWLSEYALFKMLQDLVSQPISYAGDALTIIKVLSGETDLATAVADYSQEDVSMEQPIPINDDSNVYIYMDAVSSVHRGPVEISILDIWKAKGKLFPYLYGTLWVNGAEIFWDKVFPDEDKCRTDLPGYVFERQSYWLEQELTVGEPTGKNEKELYHSRPQLDNPWIGPKDELQKIIVRQMEEVLKIRPIGIRDDFFELGGNSLLVTQLLSKINAIIDKRISFETVFETATAESLAESIGTCHEKGEDQLISFLDEIMNEAK